MEPRVEIASGRIEGSREDGVLVFRGIPYARPPQGALRLRAPLPPDPWSGVREAKAFGAAAPQTPGRLAALLGSPTETFAEDCLLPERLDAGRADAASPAGARLAPRRRLHHRLGIAADLSTARASRSAATSSW